MAANTEQGASQKVITRGYLHKWSGHLWERRPVNLFNGASTPFTGVTTPANTPLIFGTATGKVISISDLDAVRSRYK